MSSISTSYRTTVPAFIRFVLLTATLLFSLLIFYSVSQAGGFSKLPFSSVNSPDAVVDLYLENTISPGPHYIGSNILFTLIVGNLEQSNASSVILTNTFPAGLTAISATYDGGACDRVEASQVVCNLHTIQNNNPKTVLVTAIATTEGIYSSSALVTTTDTDTDPGNNSVQPEVEILAAADLSTLIEAMPNTAVAGQVFTYSIQITNNGPSTTRQVKVTNTLPISATLLSTSPSQYECYGEGVVLCSIESIEPQTTATIDLQVSLSPEIEGDVTNFVLVDQEIYDPNFENNHDELPISVSARADLGVTLTGSPNPVTAGQDLTYTIQVSNDGPSTARQVKVTNPIPVGTTFKSVYPGFATCQFAANTLTCDQNSLAPEASFLVTFTVSVNPASRGNIFDQVSVSANTEDNNSTNNSDNTATTINAQADLSVTIRAIPDPVLAGEALTYTFQITNRGPSTTGAIMITDTLPVSVTLLSATPSQNGVVCSGTTVVKCTFNSLGTIGTSASASLRLVVSVSPHAQGELANFATIEGASFDPNLQNNTTTLTTPIKAQADLEVALSILPDHPIVPGTELTYLITVLNKGPSTAREVNMVNTFPTGMTFKSSSPDVSVCSQDGNRLTCTQASLAPDDSLSIRAVITVNPDTEGELTNLVNITASTEDIELSNNITSLITTVLPPVTIAWIGPVTTGDIYVAQGGPFSLEVSSGQPSRVAVVYFLRWDPLRGVNGEYVIIGSVYQPPYSITFNPESLNLGWNEIDVVAYDTYGNPSQKQWIWVVRNNRVYLPAIFSP